MTISAANASALPAAPVALTRADIDGVAIGDTLFQTLDTAHGVPRPGARWSSHLAGEIVAISYRGVSVKGFAYVGGYCRFGDKLRSDGSPNTSTISFSIGEGDLMYRVEKGPGPDSEARD